LLLELPHAAKTTDRHNTIINVLMKLSLLVFI